VGRGPVKPRRGLVRDRPRGSGAARLRPDRASLCALRAGRRVQARRRQRRHAAGSGGRRRLSQDPGGSCARRRPSLPRAPQGRPAAAAHNPAPALASRATSPLFPAQALAPFSKARPPRAADGAWRPERRACSTGSAPVVVRARRARQQQQAWCGGRGRAVGRACRCAARRSAAPPPRRCAAAATASAYPWQPPPHTRSSRGPRRRLLTLSVTPASQPRRCPSQTTPLVAGLSIAAAALVGRTAVQQYVKFMAKPARMRSFYKVWAGRSTDESVGGGQQQAPLRPAPCAARAPQPRPLPTGPSRPTPPRPLQGGFAQQMDRREASLILGLRESAGEERIKDAHRRCAAGSRRGGGGGHGPAARARGARAGPRGAAAARGAPGRAASCERGAVPPRTPHTPPPTPTPTPSPTPQRIMIANHPDSGGSSFIAAKVNEAKDILLGKKKRGGSVF
jgi:hypothetical protein